MRTTQTFFAAAAGVFLLTSAAQAVTFTSLPGAPDPGFGPGETLLVDFEGDLPDGYTLEGAFQFGTASSPAAAQPADNTSRFLYVSSANPTGEATLGTLDLQSISFYWGSIDSFNDVDVLGAGGVTLFTLNGASIPPANGDQELSNTNQRVFFTAGMGEVITGLRFRSTGVAFELDNVAGSFADGNPLPVVPEPATWALMIAGFGMVGVANRRRRRGIDRTVTA